MSLENIYESLNDEQRQQARECKTPEEMLALSKNWVASLEAVCGATTAITV